MAKARVKLNHDFITLKKTGASVIGKYLGEFQKSWQKVDEVTGEFVPTSATVLQMEDPRGIPFQLWLDGGLKMVKEHLCTGKMVEIVKVGQKELANGNRCNSYDIYAVEA